MVGIGGAGMSAIAWVLKERGYTVTGSDREPSMYSRRLEEAGLDVRYGHRAEYIGAADLVVTSAAIPQRRRKESRCVGERSSYQNS